MGNMTYPGYYGYSMGSNIVWILVLLIKIFAFTTFLAVAIGIFMWIRRNYFESENPKNPLHETSTFRKDTPVLKAVAVIGAVVIGIVLLFAIFNTFGRYGMNYGYGISSIYIITAILMLIVKTLIAVLVISLIMAAVAMIKDQYDRDELNIYEAENKKQL